ncbi:UNVERIFIED_CONTAM: hypothetical protein FKN15_058239 [Acipenser sinensis]
MLGVSLSLSPSLPLSLTCFLFSPSCCAGGRAQPKCPTQSLDLSELAKAAKKKLQALSNRLFEELAMDVYDEVDRRENDAVDRKNEAAVEQLVTERGMEEEGLRSGSEFHWSLPPSLLSLSALLQSHRSVQDLILTGRAVSVEEHISLQSCRSAC